MKSWFFGLHAKHLIIEFHFNGKAVQYTALRDGNVSKSVEIALRVNEVSQRDVGKLWWKGVARPLRRPRPCKTTPVEL